MARLFFLVIALLGYYCSAEQCPEEISEDPNFDPCDENPCLYCGTCTKDPDTALGYTCDCVEGTYGPSCQFTNDCKVSAGPIGPLEYNSGQWLNIFVDLKFDCSGPVTKWSFWAKNNVNFYLSVWRPNESDDEWTFVGANYIEVDLYDRIYVVYVPKSDWIQAEAGDVIGISYPRTGPGAQKPTQRGTIPYANSPDFPWDNPGSGGFSSNLIPENYSANFSRLHNVQIFHDDINFDEPRSGVRFFERYTAVAGCINCIDPCDCE